MSDENPVQVVTAPNMTAITQGIDRIPDSLGYLVLNEDGAVLSSGGDLENDEPKADIFLNILLKSASCPMPGGSKKNLKRVSVIYESFFYVITSYAGKVYVCKRKNMQLDPVNA